MALQHDRDTLLAVRSWEVQGYRQTNRLHKKDRYTARCDYLANVPLVEPVQQPFHQDAPDAYAASLAESLRTDSAL